MVRLFIAALLPDQIKQALQSLIADLKPRGDGVRWVAVKNMHLTLKFIGEIGSDLITPIEKSLGGVLKGRRRFEVKISECGGFPDLGKPRVLWAGLEGAEPAVEMAAAIDRELSKLGIKEENRPLSPHLTLGRIKYAGDLKALTSYMRGLTLTTEPVILDRVALVKSTLTSGGPIYENLKLFTLD